MCTKAFGKKSHPIRHQRIHSGERPYSCEVCNKALSRKNSLIRHRNIHSGEGPYIVLYCLLYIPAIHKRSEPQDTEFVIVVLHLNKYKITIVYTYSELDT